MEFETALRGAFGQLHDDLAEGRTLSFSHEEVIEEVLATSKTAEDASASLEQMLDISLEMLDKHGGKIDRHTAAALESFCPGVLPKRAPVNSFTIRPSMTNANIAIEAVDNKIVAIILAFIAAIIAFIAGLSKSSKGKKKKQQETVAKIKEDIPKEVLEPIAELQEHIEEEPKRKVDYPVFDAFDEEQREELELSALNVAMFDHYMTHRPNNAFVDPEFLRETLTGRSGPVTKYYTELHLLNDYFLEMSAGLSQMLDNKVKQALSLDLSNPNAEEELALIVRALHSDTINTVTDGVSVAVRRLTSYIKMAGLSTQPFEERIEEVNNQDNKPSSLLSAFPHMLGQVTNNNINEITAYHSQTGFSEFPKDMIKNIVKYTTNIRKAAVSKAFQPSAIATESYFNRLVAGHKKTEALVTKLADHLGHAGTPMQTEISETLKCFVQAQKACETFNALTAGGLRTLEGWHKLAEYYSKEAKKINAEIKKQVTHELRNQF